MARVDMTGDDLALVQRVLPYLQRISEEGSEHGDLTSVEIEVVISGNRITIGYGETGKPTMTDVWMAQS
jgi:NADPH-dependent glutamate synthase beta subunit-like oxidoreductase